jgi:hypothetical protein
MDIFARDLRMGDKVNCHERGWLIVKKIENKWMLHITYNDGTEIDYFEGDRLFVIRE